MKRNSTLWILCCAIVAAGAATHGDFFTARNLTNLMRQVSLNGILSLGMTAVILLGGIDLSVGSVVALCGVIAGLVQTVPSASVQGDWVAVVALLAALASGALCGLFNGLLIVRAKIVPFIVTLGLMVIARGLALLFSGGAAVAPLSETFNFMGQGFLPQGVSTGIILLILVLFAVPLLREKQFRSLVGLVGSAAVAIYAFVGYKGAPIPVVIFFGFALFAHYALNHTVFGRYIVASGSNPEAAFLSGVPVEKTTLSVYTGMGLLSGLAGALLSARLNGAMPTAGELFELDAVAAVVMGGTRLTGGVGTISGSIVGAFLIGILNNGMSLLNITEFYQKIVKGVLIIAAAWVDAKNRRNQV